MQNGHSKSGVYFSHNVSQMLPETAYSLHLHNAYELLYFLSDGGTYFIEDRKYRVKRGDLLLIRPRCYHFVRVDVPTECERYDLLFDPLIHRIDGLDRLGEDSEILHLDGNETARNVFQRMDGYAETCDGETFSALLPHLLSELFFTLALDKAEKGANSVSPLIANALRYINDSLPTLRGIGEVARHLFVSESYLFRRFKREMHQTPKQYIVGKRLLLAEQMLAHGDSPTAVCQAVGFGDYTSFYRNCRAFFGRAPSEGEKE